ncbi:DUF3592 domain-containing protein [Streptomyces sp. ISL-86]|uniref:DUF3592 domain-containing protein n=1 Tax=Streptomyces sp. ISL-86 TaxID=2819187 RepID=UPI001BE73E56|nr:DUF3592 domain-containing protein [Streptomyces sp. ISL-86]MBT2455585.1 DUF3592 domain-containing protein [Streptomyces sp. ISL-86]
MSREDPQSGRLTAVLPIVAAAAVYGWAHWCLGGRSSPSATVALVGGAVLIAAACLAYFVLVRGNGGFFGALSLGVALLLAVAAADQAAARGEATTCVVREVHSKTSESHGEGAPPARTVYSLDLDCPGGYPTELKDDRPIAPAGAEVRVAYDPDRRVSPAVEGDTSPWKSALWAVLLLAFSTGMAARRRALDSEDAR